MRLSETLHLTINDVDFSRRTILIPAEINKGRKDRVIFMVTRCLNYYIVGLGLKTYIKKQNCCFLHIEPTQY
ncbi:tyrosine-type recombinase/integrase [Clostridium botulinum]|nr:tyrosine-type recombinase/integrase [Clostridium botulinum]